MIARPTRPRSHERAYEMLAVGVVVTPRAADSGSSTQPQSTRPRSHERAYEMLAVGVVVTPRAEDSGSSTQPQSTRPRSHERAYEMPPAFSRTRLRSAAEGQAGGEDGAVVDLRPAFYLDQSSQPT